jgi:hypothetical protein
LGGGSGFTRDYRLLAIFPAIPVFLPGAVFNQGHYPIFQISTML